MPSVVVAQEPYASTSLKEVGFPNIARRYSRSQLGSDAEVVRRVRTEFERAWTADQQSYFQLMNDYRMYFGWPTEQWSIEALRYKEAHKQRAAQYNIIKPKVHIFHGSILSDEYDFKYTPIDRRRTTAIKSLEDAYYSDKEECGFDYQYSLAVLNGCINLGVLEIAVTTQYDPRGNICFLSRDPSHIVFDPYWLSDDDAECTRCWKHGHMTAKQIVGRWKNLPSSPKLEEALRKAGVTGSSWQERSLDDSNTPFPLIEDAYHVVEASWIEEVHKKRIIARGANGRWVPFPVTDDNEMLELFAQRVGVSDWQNGAEVVPYVDRILHQAITCDQLFPDKCIEFGKPEIQIQRLQYLQFTCYRDMVGRNMGIVGALLDPQLDINYSRSKIIDLLSAQHGGAILYDKRKIPEETDQQDFERNHNDSGRAFGLDGGVNEFHTHVSDGRVSGELMNEVNNAFGMSDRVTNAPAAMSAETQSAGEPASLFAMKLRQAKTATRSVDDRVKKLRSDMAVAYFLQARISYAGAERSFTSKDGTREANFNVELPDGSMLNRIDLIPRCSVSIEEAPGNMSRVMRDRSEIAAIIKAIPPEYREHLAILIDRLLKTTDISGQTKDDIEDATEMERIKARLASIAQIATTLATQKQAEAAILTMQRQIEQLVQTMGAQRGQGGPGGPGGPGGQSELPLAISEAEEQAEPEVSPAMSQGRGGGAGGNKEMGPGGAVEAMVPQEPVEPKIPQMKVRE